MPSDFNFSYSFDYTELINTFDSTYGRRYNLHDTTVSLTLTSEEKQKIYKTMMENEVLTLPDIFEINTKGMCIAPSKTDFLIIQINRAKKKIRYSYECDPPKEPKLSERYLNITKVILDIIKTKKQVEKLPGSDCVFL